MFVTFISRISGFAGTEPLQRHYRPLQSHYESLRSHYGVVTDRCLAATSHCHFGAIPLQRACALQRHSLRSQPSSEGLAPWVVPSAPLPQGDSLWLASSALCMRQAPRKRRGPVADFMGDTIAQVFGFCNRVAPPRRGSCCGGRLPSAGGLAWPAPLSHRPTLQRFWVQGDSPCTPGGGCAPCTLLGGRGEGWGLVQRMPRRDGR